VLFQQRQYLLGIGLARVIVQNIVVHGLPIFFMGGYAKVM
jgi:hypothetical protein